MEINPVSKIWLRLLILAAVMILITSPALAANKKSAKIIPAADETATVQPAEDVVIEKPAKADDSGQPDKVQAAPPAQDKTVAKPVRKEPAAKPKAKPKKATSKKSGGNPLGLSSSSQAPIKIISNRLVVDDKSGTVIFTGKVKAVQGDTILYCDKLTVFYAKTMIEGKSEEDAQRELTRIVTEGHVKVVLPGQIAYGQKGVYQIAEGLITLKGRPKIVRGGNTLTGDKIIVYLNENKAVVEGGRQMVEAVIIPQSLEQSDQAAADAGGAGPATGVGTVSAGTN